MACFPRGMTFLTRLHSEGDRLMVSQDVKGTTFEKVSKVFSSQIHGQKFPTEGTAPCFSRLEFFRKEGKRHPHLILVFLQERSDGRLGGIYLKASGSRLLRKGEKNGFSESRLSVRESLPSSIRPSDLGRLSSFLPLQQRSKRCKKSCRLRNEAMVESDHTKKLSELTLSFRKRKQTNGRDSVLKRQNS